jgi:hypothetical protein
MDHKQVFLNGTALSTRGDRESVTIDRYPDVCPHCQLGGGQYLTQAWPILLRDGHRRTMWVGMRCPLDRCGLPYYAVFIEPHSPIASYGPDYEYSYSTPVTPRTYQRDLILAEVSENFYNILDQAFAAEQRRLDLIAGMGYRKALEYLVKDYVTRDIRKRFTEAADDAEKAAAVEEWGAVVENNLSTIIKMIPHTKLKLAAERAAWLGNDETHYTRNWDKQDVDDLKRLLHIVMQYISNEIETERYVEAMPRPEKKKP